MRILVSDKSPLPQWIFVTFEVKLKLLFLYTFLKTIVSDQYKVHFEIKNLINGCWKVQKSSNIYRCCKTISIGEYVCSHWSFTWRKATIAEKSNFFCIMRVVHFQSTYDWCNYQLIMLSPNVCMDFVNS